MGLLMVSGRSLKNSNVDRPGWPPDGSGRRPDGVRTAPGGSGRLRTAFSMTRLNCSLVSVLRRSCEVLRVTLRLIASKTRLIERFREQGQLKCWIVIITVGIFCLAPWEWLVARPSYMWWTLDSLLSVLSATWRWTVNVLYMQPTVAKRRRRNDMTNRPTTLQKSRRIGVSAAKMNYS